MKRFYPFPDTTGLEPTLNELLNCSVMHTLLAYDKLTVSDVRYVVESWQKMRAGAPRHQVSFAA